MLPRLVRSVKTLECRQTLNNLHLSTTRCQSSNPDSEEKKQPESKRLKEWRKPWIERENIFYSKLKLFGASQPNVNMITFLQTPLNISPSGVKNWLARRECDMHLEDQKFVAARHEALGSDLAAAHFIVHRGGKIKFFGQDKWVQQDEKEEYDLPGNFRSDYILTAIDASGMNLLYEGLQNLTGLMRLSWLSLKGCQSIDDWCMDRISGEFPRLEYLDISDCKNVTERGLEALYRCSSLKTLIVTNHYKSSAFELTCLMLEDCYPNLQCQIIVPEEVPEQSKAQIESQ